MFKRCYREVPADADYVLRLLLDDYGLQQKLFPHLSNADFINQDTTVGNWFVEREFEDLWLSEVAGILNMILNVELNEKEWIVELQTARNLSELAELLAPKVKRTELIPLRIAGTRCVKAAAFLIVRERLRQSGIDVEGITPSTPVELVLKNEPVRTLYKLFDLIPELYSSTDVEFEQASAFKEWTNPGAPLAYGMIIALPSLLGMLFDSDLGVMVSVAFIAVVLLIHLVVPTYITRVKLRDIHTFRDLSERIAQLQSPT